MSYKIEITPLFERQLKRLSKKFPSVTTEYASLIVSIKKDPRQGDSLGNNCYKIRMPIASKGKGKSGGARVITHLQIVKSTVFLLSIYDKSDKCDISDKDLLDWLKILKN